MRAAGGFGEGGNVRPNGCCQMGKIWRQAFELNRPFLFIISVRGGRFGGLVYPLTL